MFLIHIIDKLETHQGFPWRFHETMGASHDVWELWRNYWPVLVGNAMEWYEFAVYGALGLTQIQYDPIHDGHGEGNIP